MNVLTSLLISLIAFAVFYRCTIIPIPLAVIAVATIDAFVEMMAYYYGVRDYTAKTADEKKVCDDAIVELSMMASANGFRPAKARREARALVKRTMVRVEAKRLLKAA